MNASATKDNRPIFSVLDSEREESESLDNRIARAADKAARRVDFDTIRMFRERGLPLPPRLAKIASTTDYDFKDARGGTSPLNVVRGGLF